MQAVFTRERSRFSLHTMLGVMVLSVLFPVALRCQSRIATTSEVAEQADVVVVGKVGGLVVEWVDGRTRIQTRVMIAVDQYVKGDASTKSMTVIVPGGKVDGVGEVYSHAPRFLRNENVVLFAKLNISSAGTGSVFSSRRCLEHQRWHRILAIRLSGVFPAGTIPGVSIEYLHLS